MGENVHVDSFGSLARLERPVVGCDLLARLSSHLLPLEEKLPVPTGWILISDIRRPSHLQVGNEALACREKRLERQKDFLASRKVRHDQALEEFQRALDVLSEAAWGTEMSRRLRPVDRRHVLFSSRNLLPWRCVVRRVPSFRSSRLMDPNC